MHGIRSIHSAFRPRIAADTTSPINRGILVYVPHPPSPQMVTEILLGASSAMGCNRGEEEESDERGEVRTQRSSGMISGRSESGRGMLSSGFCLILLIVRVWRLYSGVPR